MLWVCEYRMRLFGRGQEPTERTDFSRLHLAWVSVLFISTFLGVARVLCTFKYYQVINTRSTLTHFDYWAFKVLPRAPSRWQCMAKSGLIISISPYIPCIYVHPEYSTPSIACITMISEQSIEWKFLIPSSNALLHVAEILRLTKGNEVYEVPLFLLIITKFYVKSHIKLGSKL